METLLPPAAPRHRAMTLSRRRFLQSAAGLGLAACGDQLHSQPRSTPPLTIAAAASLQDSLHTIQAHLPHLPPATFTFGGSGTLQFQIAQGAPVDLLITASPLPVDRLEAQGLLLPQSRRDLVGNSLVLITGQGGEAIEGFADLASFFQANPRSRLAVGNPAIVPAGDYGVAVLRFLGLYDRLEPQLIWAQDVRQVLAYVETGNVAAGLVYETDARLRETVRSLATAPEGSHPPIVYPGAVIRASPQPEAARQFLDALAQPTAQAIFQRYGFRPLPTTGTLPAGSPYPRSPHSSGPHSQEPQFLPVVGS